MGDVIGRKVIDLPKIRLYRKGKREGYAEGVAEGIAQSEDE